jgi:hypothetical protein
MVVSFATPRDRDKWPGRQDVLGCATTGCIRDPVRTRQRTGFDLTGAGRDRKVGNCRIFRFTRAVRNHGCVTGLLRHSDGGKRFGQTANLVQFDQNRVSHVRLDTVAQDFGIGDEQIVANELNTFAKRIGQRFPACPVRFVHTVFDRQNGITIR